MRGKWILFAGSVFFIAAAAGALVYYRRQAAVPKPVARATPQLPSGAEIHLTGTIRAANLIQIAAPIDGTLEEIPVKPGDEVVEGQILARIANDTLRENEHETSLEADRAQARLSGLESELIAIRLEQSRADAEAMRTRIELQRADKIYQRQALLNREGATPRNTFEKAQAEYQSALKDNEAAQALAASYQDRVQQVSKSIDTARADLTEKKKAHESAQEEMNAANILAPVDGLIVAIKKGAGDEVQKTAELFELATDLSQLELVVEPDAATLPRLAAGQPALIQLAEVPGDGVPGTVRAIEDNKVYIEFSSPTTLVRPGMTAVVRMKLN